MPEKTGMNYGANLDEIFYPAGLRRDDCGNFR
jgi:hypothetical protein